MTAHASAQRLAFLAAAGDLLSSSLDYQQTLQHVARLSAPALGDLCIVDIVEGDRLQRLATAHVLPAKHALLEQLVRHNPHVEGSRAPAALVLESGETLLFENVTPEVVASHTGDAEHARLILALGMRSHIAVPMKIRGVVLGVISIGITESDRRFGAEDVALAEELARRAAVAVDNARLYAAAQQELARRQEAEGDLRRSEARFRAIVEQSPLSTQILSPDGTTVDVNRAWTALWGLGKEDLAGYSVLQDPQLDGSGISPLLRRAFAGEPVMLPAIRYAPRQSLPARAGDDLAARWVRAFAYPIKNPEGTVEEVVLLHEDVTVEHRAAELLQGSEDRLQRALSFGHINVWDWDLLTDIVTCSENAQEFWGIDVGKASDFLAVIHPGDLAAANEAARAAIEDGAEYAITYRLRSPDGGLRWASSSGRVEYDADGKAVRFLGMTTDITAHKRAEDATRMLADAGETLGASLDYQETLASLAQVVIPTLADWYAVDLITPEGELERVTVSHPDPAKVALARDVHARFPPPRDLSYGPWRVIDSGQVECVESITDEQVVRSARHPEHLEMLRSLSLSSYLCVPLQARGETLGVVTMMFAESGRHYQQTDIDLAVELGRRVAVAVDNARLYEQLQLSDRRKDEFLAMLAHELRNPLAPISTAAQLLRMSSSASPVIRSASDVISRQVAHMTELVDDLLDVSRVTRGLIQLDRQSVDIKSVVASAVEQAQSAIEAKRHALSLWMSPAAMSVDGDRARLIQVVANLLNNAAKYTPDGGAISLRADVVDGRIELTVSDSGAGIEAALLPHVFELFTQGQRTPDRTQGGLGIGLALVRSIVQLHGGEVTASSAGADRGSSFVVSLPMASATAPALSTAAPARTKRPATRRLLIVDDNEDAAAVLAEVLRLEGHDVLVAFTAGEALRLAASAGDIDLCVLDIGLPDMTGYELAISLRHIAGASMSTFVALTGYGQPEDRIRSAAAGFDHHLVKPAGVSELLAILGA